MAPPFSVSLFHQTFELTRVLYYMAALSGAAGAVFGWLAYQHYCQARRVLNRSAALWVPSLSRLGYEFDSYRGAWFGTFACCILSLVMALEPHFWMANVEQQYSVFAGWIVICAGFILGMLVFAGGRVQELIGWHPFQQLAKTLHQVPV